MIYPQSMYYVYSLSDPRDGKPFYIGKGKGCRIDDHEREARHGIDSKKCAKIMEIINEGYSIKKEIIKLFYDEDESYNFEIEIIKRIGLQNLTNATEGGRGVMKYEPNTRKPDVDILRYWAHLSSRTHKYPLGSIFFELLDGLRNDALEVMDRRGNKWVRKYLSNFADKLFELKELSGVSNAV